MSKADTTQYDFDIIHDRRNSDSVKWNYYGDDVLPMWVADMDLISPEPVIRALRERVDHGIFGYAQSIINPSGESSEFSQTIIDRLADLYDWNIQPEDILLTPGVVRGFNLACHAFCSEKDALLVQTPVYFPIYLAAKNTGFLGQQMELTHNPDGSYSVDWELFENSVTPQTSLFILCNPHNPVGKVFNQGELERTAEICLKNNVIICSDEIHCDLTFQGHPHIPIASLDPEIADNTITLLAPSKSYNIAGLECSIAIIQNKEIRECFTRAKRGLVPSVNLMGMLAGKVAYQEGGNWLSQVMAYLQANSDYLYDYIQKELPEVKMWLPEGTYLAWLDCRGVGIEGNPAKFFQDTGRVAFNDGATFGPGGDGFVRLNFGCPRPTLTEALERMKSALATI